MNKFITLPLISLGLLLLIPGCIQDSIRVYSIAYLDREALPNGFKKGSDIGIFKGESRENPEALELQTKELKKKMSIILEAKGFNVVDTEVVPKLPKYLIVFAYGNVHETKTLNVAKYIPGKSEFSTGQSSVFGSYSEQKNSTGTYVYVPEEHTFYTKTLTCYVYDVDSSNIFRKNQKPIWKAETYIVNENSDLRPYLDFLLVQLMNIFGKDTTATITTDMKKDNKSVAWLRNTYLGIPPKK